MFPSACQRTLIGLICGQITLVGYTVLRQGFYQPTLLLPLPIYTLGMMSYFKRVFEDPAGNLSLERAVALDKVETLVYDDTAYLQPILVEEDLNPMPSRRLEKGLVSRLEETDEIGQGSEKGV